MKKIFLIAAVILCLSGCNSVEAPKQTETPPAQTAAADAPQKKTIKISADSAKYDAMNVVEDCIYDITGTGEETIALLTDAEKDENGEFLWDDSQDWALVVKSSGGIYPLYDAHSHGKLSMNVSESYQEDGSTVPVIRLSISASAVFEIREYRWEDGEFTEKTAYSTGAINELTVNRY
jgi:hypothetical protein